MGWAYLGNTFNKTVISICALVSAWQPVESWVLRNPVICAQTSELFQAPQINTNKQYNIYTDKDFNMANKTSPTTLTYTKRIFQTGTIVCKTTIGVQPGHYCVTKKQLPKKLSLCRAPLKHCCSKNLF
jgi:hypothetical protein